MTRKTSSQFYLNLLLINFQIVSAQLFMKIARLEFAQDLKRCLDDVHRQTEKNNFVETFESITDVIRCENNEQSLSLGSKLPHKCT